MKYIYLLVVSLLLSSSCKQATEAPPQPYTVLKGSVIGTYYSIIYDSGRDYTTSLDSLFGILNNSLSTYVPTSTISMLNQAKDTFTYSGSADPHFLPVLEHAYAMYQLTGGDFDPTVMPLVNFWGFGYKKVDRNSIVDSSHIAVLRQAVGLDKVQYEVAGHEVSVYKPAAAELDFSANAKGYYIDQVAALLTSYGVTNMLVDIGGESIAKGHNAQNNTWTVGVNTPSEDAALQDIELAIKLENRATATSGNYRNYRVARDGSKYVHTIDPKTGMTKYSDLLSATIIAEDCMTADALATACIVMGKDKALALLDKLDATEGYLIYRSGDGYAASMTSGFGVLIRE